MTRPNPAHALDAGLRLCHISASAGSPPVLSVVSNFHMLRSNNDDGQPDSAYLRTFPIGAENARSTSPFHRVPKMAGRDAFHSVPKMICFE